MIRKYIGKGASLRPGGHGKAVVAEHAVPFVARITALLERSVSDAQLEPVIVVDDDLERDQVGVEAVVHAVAAQRVEMLVSDVLELGVRELLADQPGVHVVEDETREWALGDLLAALLNCWRFQMRLSKRIPY